MTGEQVYLPVRAQCTQCSVPATQSGLVEQAGHDLSGVERRGREAGDRQATRCPKECESVAGWLATCLPSGCLCR